MQGNILEGKGGSANEADSFTSVCQLNSLENVGASTVSQTCGLPRPFIRIALLKICCFCCTVVVVVVVVVVLLLCYSFLLRVAGFRDCLHRQEF
jgi:hypothetical protein